MPKRNLAWILVVVLIALLFWRMPQTIAGKDSVYTAFGPLVDVRTEILRRSVEPVDDGRLSAVATRAGIEAMIRDLKDRHAQYYDRETYREFQKRTEGVFGGVGVDVRMNPQGLLVLSRVRNGPAWQAGIQAGDVIVAIDGIATSELGLVESVNRLNGPADTPIVLKVRSREGGVRVRRMRRAEIEINPVRGWTHTADGGWQYWIDSRRRIGYVRLIKFFPGAVDRLDAAINPLMQSGLAGLILDLRENTGGLLRSAIDIADRFLDSGLIVSTRGPKSDAREWFAQREDTYPAVPLVVLVNGSTASAAEILSGALQDHHRAFIIGERTYGKGSVQELIPLEDGQSAIKITTAYYYLPSGRCLQKRANARPTDAWGVRPDVTIPLTTADRERWLQVWHEVGLEGEDDRPTSGAANSRPTTRPNGDDDNLERLLTVDPHLRAALNRLRSPASRNSARGGGSSNPGAESEPRDGHPAGD